jgi:branched-chain amino acid transport system permease protein
MKKNTKLILSLAAIVGILLLSVWGQNNLDDYVLRLLNMWGLYIILVCSFNLIFGFTGQFSLAHAGLIAVGAYTVSILTLSPEAKVMSFLITPPLPWIENAYWPFLPSLLLGGLLAAFVGFLIGAPALRMHGDYLLIVTFGFSEVIRLLFVNLPMICNGAMGLKGVPNQITLTYVAVIVMITVFVTKRLIDSSYGRALKCIREDEIAAEAVGVNLFYHKMLSFVVASFFVGIAGGLFSNILGTVDPNTFRPYLTYAVVTIAVLGGVQSLTGGILAAGIYTVMSELLRSVEAPRVIFNYSFPGIPGMRMLAFAIMLLFLILFARGGLMGSREFSWDGIYGWVIRHFKKSNGAENREHTGS